MSGTGSGLDGDYITSLQDPMVMKNHWLWCAIAAPRRVSPFTTDPGQGPRVQIPTPFTPYPQVSTGSSSVISEYRDIYQGYLWWGVTMNAGDCRPNDKPWGYAPKPFAVYLPLEHYGVSGAMAYAHTGDFQNSDYPYVQSGKPAYQPSNCCQKSLTLTEFVDGPITIPAGLGLKIQNSVMRRGDGWQQSTPATPKNFTLATYSSDLNHIDCAVTCLVDKHFTRNTRWIQEMKLHMKRTLRYYYGSTPLNHADIDAINALLPVGSVAAGGGFGSLYTPSPYTTNVLAPAFAIAHDGLAALGILDNEIFPDPDGVWRPAATTDVAWVLITAGYHDDDIMQITLTYTSRAVWSYQPVGWFMSPQTLDVDIDQRIDYSFIPRAWGLDYYDLRRGFAPRIVT